ncbi:Protein CASP [Amphibalanus amphitrite]|uniref:Protein CASP n=1 Tax=Amphibalanus amphitrite TaxID=1232801 RepID=A0A6A4VB26_AMPAM|nr:Protein CASP [Amphibalanus amphitrite]
MVGNLGVVFDGALTWEAHVAELSRRCMGVLIGLSHARHCLPDGILKTIVTALVISRVQLRIQELEQERNMAQHEMSLKDTEIDDLRRDNLKLFEKIRFLQSYSSQKPKKPGQDVESRYSSQYEQSLDPFSSFSRQERARKYSQLSPFEKVTLSMGQCSLCRAHP